MDLFVWENRMPQFIMMIGLPGSGKSTVCDGLEGTILSTDNMIENFATNWGKTYNEVFKDVIKEFEVAFFKQIEWNVDHERDFIVDRTNLSVKSRARILQMISKRYKKTAYVVLCPNEDEHNRRLASRPGKTIPPNVIQSMKANFVLPTFDEGFNIITTERT